MAKAGTVGRLAAAIYNRTAGRDARARVVHTYHGHVLEGYFSPAKTQRVSSASNARSRALTDRIVAISPRDPRPNCSTSITSARADQYRVVPLGFELGAAARPSTTPPERAPGERSGIPADAHVVTHRRTADGHQAASAVSRNRAADRPRAIRRAMFLIAGDGELRGELEADGSRARHRRPRALSRLAARPGDHLRRHATCSC